MKTFDECITEIIQIHRNTEAELKVTEQLLAERQRVLDTIPPCPTHGGNCVPWAVAWIKSKLKPPHNDT